VIAISDNLFGAINVHDRYSLFGCIIILCTISSGGCTAPTLNCSVSKLENTSTLTRLVSARYEAAHAGTKVESISYSNCGPEDQEKIGGRNIDKCVVGELAIKDMADSTRSQTRRYLDLCGNVIGSFDD
jgi:hypothetical protein